MTAIYDNEKTYMENINYYLENHRYEKKDKDGTITLHLLANGTKTNKRKTLEKYENYKEWNSVKWIKEYCLKYPNPSTAETQLTIFSGFLGFYKMECQLIREMASEKKSEKKDVKRKSNKPVDDNIPLLKKLDEFPDNSHEDLQKKMLITVLLKYPTLRRDYCQIKFRNIDKEIDNFYENGKIEFRSYRKLVDKKDILIRTLDEKDTKLMDKMIKFQVEKYDECDYLFLMNDKNDLKRRLSWLNDNLKDVSESVIGKAYTTGEFRHLYTSNALAKFKKENPDATQRQIMNEIENNAYQMNHSASTAIEEYIENVNVNLDENITTESFCSETVESVVNEKHLVELKNGSKVYLTLDDIIKLSL